MFGKFFASAFTGSMMASGPELFSVWAYVIAHAVKSRVELNPRMLAAVIGSTPDRMREAIDKLCAPDEASRSKEHDGRRLIREGEFQYLVVNHEHYRNIRDEDGRREYNRVKKREQRARDREVKPPVNDGQRQSIVSANTEAETEAETKNSKSVAKASPTRGSRIDAEWQLPAEWGLWAIKNYPHWDKRIVLSVSEQFADHWRSQPGSKGVKLDWSATWRNWCRSDITQRAHPPSKPSADVAATARELTAQAEHAAQAVPPPQSVRSALSVLSKMRINR